jgi:putative transport protein
VADVLADEPLLLALIVVGLGAGIGAVRVKGLSLGPAAALLVGLAAGAIDESWSEAAGLELLREFGLVLFTYTVGLASGPSFANGVRRGGAAAIGTTVVLVAALGAASAGLAALLNLTPADRAGLFAGVSTNTPALQAASDGLESGDPVVAYSLAYPTAVIAMLVMTTLVLIRRPPLPVRLEVPTAPRPERIINWTVVVTAAGLPTLAELRQRHRGLGFSRIGRDGAVRVATEEQRLEPGDVVVVVGPESTVQAFTREAGQRSDVHLPLDRGTIDFRRILVSNRQLAGRRLADLDLTHRYGVVATRVRRGDDDIVAAEDFELGLGDRVRIVGPTDRLVEVARLFGDSERRLAEIDAVGLALGAAAGIALGKVSIGVGPLDLGLGIGGGPLVVGLVLGVVARSGPITWQIPHAANQLLRQVGILLFLACAGLASGSAFADAVVTRHGLEVAAAGVVLGGLFAAIIPLVLVVAVRRDSVETAGMLAGIETQPAALAYGLERSGDERLSQAYALVFPVAMIAKLIVVQFLV